MNRRVAVTGLGAICGLGHSAQDVWTRALAGQSGVSTLENTNTEALSVKFGGEVKQFTIAEELLPAKERDRFDKFLHYALHSAHEAWMNAGLHQERPYPAERIGCLLGVGMGGFPEIERNAEVLLTKGPRRISPFFIPSLIPNMASGLITIKLGLKGINYTVSSACASAAHAISAAAYEIISGRQDVMITGGAESVLTPLAMTGFINMKALSRNNEEPHRASRPFDKDRDGFVMGEGAGIVVLEDYDKARARGAAIYAEVVGHGASSDAYHITAPHPDGEGAFQCMRTALASSGLSPGSIGYVNAHGTSTPLGDIGETKAIRRTFGPHAERLLVSSTKSMTGHLLGAAGGLESIFCILALKEGRIPPTINLDNQDPECDLNYVPNRSVVAQIEYALNNSFGFGGTNACLIFKKA